MLEKLKGKISVNCRSPIINFKSLRRECLHTLLLSHRLHLKAYINCLVGSKYPHTYAYSLGAINPLNLFGHLNRDYHHYQYQRPSVRTLLKNRRWLAVSWEIWNHNLWRSAMLNSRINFTVNEENSTMRGNSSNYKVLCAWNLTLYHFSNKSISTDS